jgi:hypothetical protein
MSDTLADILRRQDQRNGEPPPGEAPPRAGGFTFDVLTSTEFAEADYRPEWLIKRVAVAGQPLILGGPRKALKTTLLIDLALSLGSGRPFLNFFDVPRPRRTVLLSGESGEYTIQETARRVSKSKGVDLAAADVFWGFRLPQLADAGDMGVLREGLEQHHVEVAVIDPLYLCLLVGRPDLAASNLFDTGPLLLAAARACLAAGTTPILAHHARKNLAHPHEPMELEDLAFAGIQEAARQWILLSRREPYDPNEPGSHRLWLRAEGSVGHGGCWALDVEEGAQGDDFSGRRWDVAVRSAAEARQEMAEAGDTKKQQEASREDKADEAKLLIALDRLTERHQRKAAAPGKKKKGKKAAPAPAPAFRAAELETHAKVSRARTERALHRLVGLGVLEEAEAVWFSGINGSSRRTGKGYRRACRPSEKVTRSDSAESLPGVT